MGARAEYSFDGEGLTAPTDIVSRKGRRTFKAPAIFFNFLAGRFGRNREVNYRAAGRSASPTADLSDAMLAAGWFKALVAGTS
jgi:hypothetical protein